MPSDPSAATQTAGPSVGVVIRTRDRPLFLGRALASVAAQTWPHWRIALINDGGSAAPVDSALRSLPVDARQRVHVIHNPASTGRSAAFNAGLHALETDFVACLDDDDTWAPEFLERLIGFWDRTVPDAPDLGGVMSLVRALREDIVTTGATREIVDQGEDWLPNSFRRTDFFINPIAYATYRQDLYPVQWLLRRAAVVQVGGFPEDFDVMEDRAFMTRFLQDWRLAVLDQPLAHHHRRVSRQADTGRTVEMNTLDNPSYDWRKYSDLARPQTHGAGADMAALTRAVGATVIKELNDETSALWHKINGESEGLRRRLDEIEGRITHAPPPPLPQIDPAALAWSLWPTLGTARQGYGLARGAVFADRFELSLADEVPGLLFHADPDARRFVVQIAQTRDWAAVEVALDGLALPGGGVQVDMILSSREGYLFETALSLRARDGLRAPRHLLTEHHVHDCPAAGMVHVTRRFGPELISAGKTPKLSVILPRQTRHFRFMCRDLVISRI